jgi:glutamine synthetase
VGQDNALRIECRFPGGDANPYLAHAFLLAAGLAGIEQQIEPPEAFEGNGYLAEGSDCVPRALYEAIDAWRNSDLAKAAFGEIVASHYLNAAIVEQQAFDQTVTDWERERYFERG